MSLSLWSLKPALGKLLGDHSIKKQVGGGITGLELAAGGGGLNDYEDYDGQ